MKKLLCILCIILFSCLTFGKNGVRLDGPIFGKAEKSEEPPKPEFIDWRGARYNEIFLDANRCLMFYYRPLDCFQCDLIEDTIFSDNDVANKINKGFVPFMVLDDNPDFDRMMTFFYPERLPAIGFSYKRQRALWDNGDEKDLRFLVDRLYMVCRHHR